MFWRTACSSGLLLISLWLYPASLRAQVNQPPSPCSSSSPKSDSAPAQPGGDHPKVVIDEVRFDGPIHLPDSVVNAAIAEANDAELDATSETWANQFAEAGIRAAWQDRGYFKVTVKPGEVESLGGDSHEQHFRVIVHIDEGLQYHLGDLTFADAKAFSPGELRDVIPLREGEIFDISKIRGGIEALTKTYAAIGFIDFTAVPRTEIDDKLQRISLTLELDEQKQYRIEDVNVIGLDQTLEGVLRSQLVPGEVFNPAVIDDFVKQNRSSLPVNLRQEDYLQAKRDTRLGIVDLSFDFRGCRETTR